MNHTEYIFLYGKIVDSLILIIFDIFYILEAQTLLLRFIVWDNNGPITHEVMGGLKNVYAIDVVKFSFDVLSSY
jgi:hypothetical protein